MEVCQLKQEEVEGQCFYQARAMNALAVIAIDS